MKASYRQLMSEHEAIEDAARSLLNDLNDDNLGGNEISAQLGHLAKIIENHIELGIVGIHKLVRL